MSFFPKYRPAPARKENTVTLGNARFSILTPRLIRLEWASDGIFEDRKTLSVIRRDLGKCRFKVSKKSGILTIDTGELLLKYLGNGANFTPENLSVAFLLHGEPAVWHPGLDPAGNLGGTIRTLDGCEGNMHRGFSKEKGEPISFCAAPVSRDGWAVIDDSKNIVIEKLPSGERWIAARSQAARVDQYFFGYGHDYRACLADAAKVFGAPALPPRFVFGYWYSRYWPYSDTTAEEVVDAFRREDIPLDVFVLDMDWHLEGWTGYTWDRRFFPDPADFLKHMHELGLHVPLNLHPADGVGKHEEQFVPMCRAMGLDPKKTDRVPFRIGDPKYMRSYFELLHHPQEKIGVDFWWMDWQQGSVADLPGLDPLPWLNQLHYEDMENRSDRARPLIFSRFGGIGAGRYPIGFSGDTYIGWPSLAYQPYFTANAANVLYGYWSHDLGGHLYGMPEPELYTRWVQFGAFSPVMRSHSSKTPDSERRFWVYPEPYRDLMIHAVRDRYRLIPYIYSECRKGSLDGSSLCMPLYYDAPEDPEAYRHGGEYLFGSAMLVAPVTVKCDSDSEQASVSVYLPEGEWYDTVHGCFETGGRSVAKKYLLSEVPVFVRSGAVVPHCGDSRRRLGDACYPVLGATVYPGRDGSYTLYEDDGRTTDCLRGKFALIDFLQKSRGKARTLTVKHRDGRYKGFLKKRRFELSMPGVTPPESVRCNGENAVCVYRFSDAPTRPEWRYDGAAATVEVVLPKIDLTCETEIKITFASADYRADGVAPLFRRLNRIAELHNMLSSPHPLPENEERLSQDLAHAAVRIARRPETFAAELARVRKNLLRINACFDGLLEFHKDHDYRIDLVRENARKVAAILADFAAPVSAGKTAKSRGTPMKTARMAVFAAVCGLLLTCTGCISLNRMMRIGGKDMFRLELERNAVNLWPLLVASGDAVSILWPLIDYDRQGFALRPLYAQDDGEVALLWPLSGFGRSGGWAGPFYWTGESAGLFPLAAYSYGGRDMEHYFFPLWYFSRAQDYRSLHTQLYTIPYSVNRRTIEWKKHYSYDGDERIYPTGETTRHFLLYWNSRKNFRRVHADAVPKCLNEENVESMTFPDTKKGDGVFPFFSYERAADFNDLSFFFGMLAEFRHDRESERRHVLGLFGFLWRKNRYENSKYSLLYASVNREYPAFFLPRDDGSLTARSRSVQRYIFPFYGGKEFDRVVPANRKTAFLARQDELREIARKIPPADDISRNSLREKREKNHADFAALVKTFSTETLRERFFGMFPLFHTSWRTDGSAWSLLYGLLADCRTGRDRSSFDILWGLLSECRREGEELSFSALKGLLAYWGPDVRHVLGPLGFLYVNNARESTLITPLGGFSRQKNRSVHTGDIVHSDKSLFLTSSLDAFCLLAYWGNADYAPDKTPADRAPHSGYFGFAPFFSYESFGEAWDFKLGFGALAEFARSRVFARTNIFWPLGYYAEDKTNPENTKLHSRERGAFLCWRAEAVNPFSLPNPERPLAESAPDIPLDEAPRGEAVILQSLQNLAHDFRRLENRKKTNLPKSFCDVLQSSIQDQQSQISQAAAFFGLKQDVPKNLAETQQAITALEKSLYAPNSSPVRPALETVTKSGVVPFYRVRKWENPNREESDYVCFPLLSWGDSAPHRESHAWFAHLLYSMKRYSPVPRFPMTPSEKRSLPFCSDPEKELSRTAISVCKRRFFTVIARKNFTVAEWRPETPENTIALYCAAKKFLSREKPSSARKELEKALAAYPTKIDNTVPDFEPLRCELRRIVKQYAVTQKYTVGGSPFHFLWDYIFSDTNCGKFSLLGGLLADYRRCGKEEKIAILGLLYRSSSDGIRTSKLFFPFISTRDDSSNGDSEFSFLWRFLHLKKHAGNTSGHILFIPF